MVEQHTDIIIIGGGIAGLSVMQTLKGKGYDVLLLEKDAIGAGQTIASQGIIHSGLKYALGGKINRLAENISTMPERWRALLSAECMAAPSQQLFIPRGFVGGIVKLAAHKMLKAHTADMAQWPEDIAASGFNGSIISMEEPVLDIPAVLKILAAPHRDNIRKLPAEPAFLKNSSGGISGIEINGRVIHAEAFIFTAAQSNYEIARLLSHTGTLEVQARPLLMGMMKDAPFPLFAHFVGPSEKPVATVTTHTATNGSLIWYIGGGVAERAKSAPESDTYNAIRNAFARYLPQVDITNKEWATVAIDRVEGKDAASLPDAPTIHQHGNCLYAWPTKLTFAPMLADMIAERLQGLKISGHRNEWEHLPQADFATAPWDEAKWKKLN